MNHIETRLAALRRDCTLKQREIADAQSALRHANTELDVRTGAWRDPQPSRLVMAFVSVVSAALVLFALNACL